jgi:hypothetical protein
MEVLHIFLNNVAGGDVSAATKPPLAGDAVPVLCLEEPAGIKMKPSERVTTMRRG